MNKINECQQITNVHGWSSVHESVNSALSVSIIVPFQHKIFTTTWRQTAPGLWTMMGKYCMNINQKQVWGSSSLKYIKSCKTKNKLMFLVLTPSSSQGDNATLPLTPCQSDQHQPTTFCRPDNVPETTRELDETDQDFQAMFGRVTLSYQYTTTDAFYSNCL